MFMASAKPPGAPEPRHVAKDRPGPAGGKRDRNRRERTRILCEAALELFVAHGIEAVTIDQIAAKAGVAKGSFYRYFSDKTDMVEALLSTMAPELRAAMDGCADALAAARTPDQLNAAYGQMGMSLAMTVLSKPQLTLMYLQEARSPAVGARRPVRALADEIAQRAIELTEIARAHGMLRPVNPKVSALTVIGAIEQLVFNLLSGQPIGEPAEVAQSLISVMLDGLRP